MEHHSEIKGIVPVPEGHSYPQEPSFRVFQSDGIASAAVVGLDDGFFVVGGDFGLSEDIAFLIDEGNLDHSILLCDFDPSLPDHVLPVVEIVAFGGGQGRDFEDSHSLVLVAEHQFGGLHNYFKL